MGGGDVEHWVFLLLLYGAEGGDVPPCQTFLERRPAEALSSYHVRDKREKLRFRFFSSSQKGHGMASTGLGLTGNDL